MSNETSSNEALANASVIGRGVWGWLSTHSAVLGVSAFVIGFMIG